eukprot:3432591-Rhodomonas_salina.2
MSGLDIAQRKDGSHLLFIPGLHSLVQDHWRLSKSPDRGLFKVRPVLDISLGIGVRTEKENAKGGKQASEGGERASVCRVLCRPKQTQLISANSK